MQEQLEMPNPQPPERSRFGFALTLAAAAAVIVVAGLYFLPGRQSPSRGTGTAPEVHFGPAERAYALKLQLENAALSRAENFLHQEVTTLSGEVVNTGDRSLRAVELTIEFSDDLHQVVLRETRSVLVPGAAPFAPAERRSFEVSLEHIPSSWNRQQPIVRVTGIHF